MKSQTFPTQHATVVDQFGTLGLDVLRPDRICNPANKNGEDPGAPGHLDHLAGHRLKAPHFTAQKKLSVTNQFGTVLVDALRPNRLMVPASKSLSSTPPALTPPTVDHFNCYRVALSRGQRFAKIEGVTVVDEFGSQTLELRKPLELCAPANKNNENPGADRDSGHLLCYQVRSSNRTFPTKPFFMNEQFVQGPFQAIRVEEFCVPSTKVPPTTTSTSTTTSSSTTTSIP